MTPVTHLLSTKTSMSYHVNLTSWLIVKIVSSAVIRKYMICIMAMAQQHLKSQHMMERFDSYPMDKNYIVYMNVNVCEFVCLNIHTGYDYVCRNNNVCVCVCVCVCVYLCIC